MPDQQSAALVVWLVFRGDGALDRIFATQDAAQEHADDLTMRRVAGVMIEPYEVNE